MPYSSHEKQKEYYKRYAQKNKERLQPYRMKYRESNQDNIRSRDNEYKKRNREKINKQAKEYRERNKAAIYARDKAWRERSRDIIRIRISEKRSKNPEKYRNYTRNWIKDNKEQFTAWRKIYYKRTHAQQMAYKIARRERHKINGEIINPQIALVQYLKIKFNGKCFKCGAQDRLSIDHHNPLSKGFKLSEANAVLLCKSCNSRKRDKNPNEFYSKDELRILLTWFNVVTEGNNINQETSNG